MITKIVAFLAQPVTFDGFVYIMIAVCGAVAASLSSDDAAKYITPATLWLLRQFVGWAGALFLALKMYRSTTFAEYRQAKNGSYHTGDTQMFVKSNEKTPLNPPTP